MVRPQTRPSPAPRRGFRYVPSRVLLQGARPYPQHHPLVSKADFRGLVQAGLAHLGRDETVSDDIIELLWKAAAERLLMHVLRPGTSGRAIMSHRAVG